MDSRRNLKKCMAVAVLLVVGSWVYAGAAYGQPWDGNGVEGDPYQIWTAEDMQAIGADSNYWDAHFKLMQDIDLSAYTGTSFNIIGTSLSNPFTGVFDGNGHVISNFSYSTTGADYIGLFGCIWNSNAEIRDLGLNNPNIDVGEETCAGSLVGLLRSGSVTKCCIDGGSVSGGYRVGGLVGSNGGYISNCYAGVSVIGVQWVGGLVGGGTVVF